LTFAALAASTLFACPGNDPVLDPATATVAKPDGERGGKCFPNLTCTGTDLTCVDGFCLRPGDPGPGAEGGIAPGGG
jgi:hypothetical protein